MVSFTYKVNLNILTQFSSEQAKNDFSEYVKYRLDRPQDFCLQAMLDTNQIFHYIDKTDLDLMKALQPQYYRPDFIKNMAIIWKEANPSDNFPRGSHDIFKMVKRVAISLLLQKKTSSDQERVFSHLSNASHTNKYLSRTLSSTIIKAFNNNKAMFAGSAQEELLKRKKMEIIMKNA